MENNINQSDELINSNNDQNLNTNSIPEESSSNNPQTLSSGYTKMENHPNDFEDFTEPKSHSKAWLVFLILFIILVGGCLVYYFVIDSPKNIFNTVTKNALTLKSSSNNQEEIKNMFIDSEITYNIKSSNPDYATYEPYFNILNNLKFNFSLGTDTDNNFMTIGLNTTYKDTSMLNLDAMMDLTDNRMYIDLHELYNQKLQLEMEESNQSKNEEDTKDLTTFINSLGSAFKETLDKANYSKKIVKLDEEYLKRVTLKIDNTFINNLGNILLHDELFIDSTSKLFSLSEEEIIDTINQMMAENYKGEFSLYLTPFGNNVKMVEFIQAQDSLKIWQESDDKYTFEITENYNLIYRGSLTIKEVDDNTLVSVTVDIVSLGITLECQEKITVKENISIQKMDTSNSKNIQELTEEDSNTIMTNIFSNKAINNLFEDLGLGELFNFDDTI